MKGEVITYTGFSGCDMYIYTGKEYGYNEEGDGIAYGVQAVTWGTSPDNNFIAGSLVLFWTPNPVEGPHDIIITSNNRQTGDFGARVLYGIELIDRETGESISWLNAIGGVCYNFIAKGYTGWMKNN